jgi:hypothetical protein
VLVAVGDSVAAGVLVLVAGVSVGAGVLVVAANVDVGVLVAAAGWTMTVPDMPLPPGAPWTRQ